MDKAALDPPRTASEKALQSRQLFQVALQVLLVVLFVAQLSFRAETRGHDGIWFVMLAFVVALATADAVLVVRLLAVTSWRRLPVRPDERLLWGTFAERVMPSGGAAYPGRLALSTTRLRYLPDPISRLRGAVAEEWPAAALHDVRVTPVDARRRRRGGRWVMVDVAGGDPITLMSAEAHLVADELFEALSVATPTPRD